MVIALSLLLSAAALAISGYTIYRVRRRAPVVRTVRVHLRSGPSLEGVLRGFEQGHYVVERAVHLSEEGQRHPLDGVQWVDRENVHYLQVIAPS